MNEWYWECPQESRCYGRVGEARVSLRFSRRFFLIVVDIAQVKSWFRLASNAAFLFAVVIALPLYDLQ